MEISVKSAPGQNKRMERQIVDVHYSWICSPRKSYESMEMDIKTTRVLILPLKEVRMTKILTQRPNVECLP